MTAGNDTKNTLLSSKAHRKIGYSVVACHFLVIVVVLTGSIIAEWLKKEETRYFTRDDIKTIQELLKNERNYLN